LPTAIISIGRFSVVQQEETFNLLELLVILALDMVLAHLFLGAVDENFSRVDTCQHIYNENSRRKFQIKLISLARSLGKLKGRQLKTSCEYIYLPER